VDFESVVLAPSMVLPGSKSGASTSPAQVAEATIGTLTGVPATLAGIAFLPGSQRPERAAENLAAMQHIPHLWPLTFCFGPLLAGTVLAGPAPAAWRDRPARGRQARWTAAQRAVAQQVAANAAAVGGRYTPDADLELAPV
jgi:fructose-bisphosphate aldolase class I